MQFAIFDTGAGFLQWLGEAVDIQAAIQAMGKEIGLTKDSFDNELSDDFIVVYQLTEAEVRTLEQATANEEEVFQDFSHEGVDFTYGEVLGLVGG